MGELCVQVCLEKTGETLFAEFYIKVFPVELAGNLLVKFFHFLFRRSDHE